MMGEFTFEGREAIEKEVKEIGTGAHILVPKDWLGETVAVVRLQNDDGEDTATQDNAEE